MPDGPWDAVSKAIDLLKLVLIIGLIVAVGYGLLNLDAVLQFTGKAIDLLKAAR